MCVRNMQNFDGTYMGTGYDQLTMLFRKVLYSVLRLQVLKHDLGVKQINLNMEEWSTNEHVVQAVGEIEYRNLKNSGDHKRQKMGVQDSIGCGGNMHLKSICKAG
jgi:hypothetical protein